MDDRLQHHLRELESHHLLRALRTVEARQGVQVRIDGRDLVVFSSNDYLGLANHPAVNDAAVAAIRQWGTGVGAARLISGNLLPHQQLEAALATFKGVEATLTMSSGYATNIGIIPALTQQGGILFADRLCHASLIDGCRLSRADLRFFQHNDIADLERLLTRRKSGRPALIVTEGVFSMDGDVAPLPEIVRLSQCHGADVLVDDAHGTGVMGKHGRGTLEHCGVAPADVIQMGTLSKAVGTSGGYVAGSKTLIQYLVNTARSFLYTTAPPPAIVAAATAALGLIQSDETRRTRLWTNREYLHDGLVRLGFSLPKTKSPILPVLLSHAETALSMSQKLQEAGFLIPAIRPPTVPEGTSRLRITVSSEHTREQLDHLLESLGKIGQEMKAI